MENNQGRILYVGGFELPDKNAAAQRVISNAKALKKLGYDVEFLNQPKKVTSKIEIKEYFGFKCYEAGRKKQLHYFTSCNQIARILREQNYKAVIAYNFPSIALSKLINECKKRKVLCIADATEWYTPAGNFIFRMVKKFDTDYRMKYLHFKMDGVIAISDYLYQFYSKGVRCVKIPPLVDISELKWEKDVNITRKMQFVYAGSPSNRKERLDIIVSAIIDLGKTYNVALKVIGITKEQFCTMYPKTSTDDKIVHFCGWISHEAAVKAVKESNWSIIVRNNTLSVLAGFPTKVVESISSGVPVVANKFSSIQDYLNDSNSVLFEDVNDIKSALEKAITVECNVNQTIFDYHGYLQLFKTILE